MNKLLVLCISCIISFSFTCLTFAEETETTREDKIKQVQAELTTLEFYKGEVSGKMNKDTRDAIKEFQKKEMDINIPNGLLDKKTCDKISEKAEKKMKKDKEGATSGVEKGKSKIEEGAEKVKEGMGMGK